MSGKFLAYEYVRPGFEMIIDKNQVSTWNLWWNTKLTDDPEAWDDEIRLINEIQGGLGELTEDQRLTRAQMAEFCRYNPLFPQSIDILCKEIGEGRFRGRAIMGCEGRGLLDSLLGQQVGDQWKDILKEYALSLENWLVQDRPQTVRESKVFGFLGKPTDGKRDIVKKLISVIRADEPSAYSLMKLSESVCKDASADSKALRNRPFNCFGCQAGVSEKTSAPECPCCYTMYIDASLLCAGMSNEKGTALGLFKRFAEENILAYSLAIDSWLRKESPKPVTTMTPTIFLDKASAIQISKGVHSSLGTRTGTKEWLTACLLKTLKDNQRWHGGKELIDGFLDHVSWLQNKL